MHLEVNNVQVHKFEERFLLLILLHFGFCVKDVVHITFLLISDLSGLLFSVTTLQITD